MIFDGDGALSIAELWALITVICPFIISVSAAFKIIVDAIKKLKAPEVLQDERLKKIEDRMDEFEQYFLNDKKRIEALESGDRVTQRAILALLGHAIDGNNQEQLETARNNLNDFLINR